MKKIRIPILLLLALFLGGQALPARAQGGIRVLSDKVTLQFPNSATFTAEFSSGANITEVALEYGVDQLTCGTVVAKAFPEFTPAADVTVTWTWEMLQSGSLPPGATLWWQWQVTDAGGAQFTSPKKTVTWLDDIHAWQTISGGNINLHYYEGGESFGRELHDAATAAMTRLSREVGLRPAKPVDIYIYANTDDLKAAILYEPSWVGGQAYPAHNIIIIGISQSNLEWGKSTEAHELTHVLVGQLTFSCLGFIPTWLNEGLAMVGEGGLDSYQQGLLDQAIADNTLPSLRALTGGFSEEATRASLSYAASYSVTNYLITTYGQAKMNTLLTSLRDGSTADEALLAIYGFNVDGLDDAWRASIGAAARSGTSNPTPVPTPTVVPTIAPYSGAPVTPYAPTPLPTKTTTPGTTATPDPFGTLRAYATQTAAALAANATPTPQPPLTERLGISSEVLLVIEFAVVCGVIAIAAVAGPILLTVRRKHRRKS
ncbi:MAG: peptidase MA domain-containing protein [Anaerolineaceae bacterium]|nr:MAG: peptidase MA domain-containing protein [Anaerolineaceae bacterium]